MSSDVHALHAAAHRNNLIDLSIVNDTLFNLNSTFM